MRVLNGPRLYCPARLLWEIIHFGGNMKSSSSLVVVAAVLSVAPVMAVAQELELSKIGGYATGAFDEGAAEISAYDAASKRLFVVNGADDVIDVLDLSDPTKPTKVSTLPLGAGSPNSVAVK